MRFSKSLRRIYLSYLSSPAADRPIYRAIARRGVRSILELGVGMGLRARRMIETAAAGGAAAAVRYTGVDLFEARPSHRPGMTIKRAHRVLGALGARVRLVPGDPASALSRTANSLSRTDLVVIGADQELDSLAGAWFYMPRMLSEQSLVCWERESPGRGVWYELLTPADVEARAAQSPRGRRRAA